MWEVAHMVDEDGGKRALEGPAEDTAEGPAEGPAGGPAEGPAEGADGAERYLLCPEEWDDPAGRNVVCEYHKEGLAGVEGGAEVDIGPPEGLAGAAGGGGIPRLASEYHKDGAPFVEGAPDGGRPPTEGTTGGEAGGPARARGRRTGEGLLGRALARGVGAGRRGGGRRLDLATAELALYALSRAVLGHGVRIPIRVPDGIDMDVVVRGRDVVLNTNNMELVVPELTVWHVTYAFKGRPIVELGRGVRDGVRVHKWNALRLLLAVWSGGRRRRRQAARAARDAERGDALLATRA
jgi:hypothetical protein